MQFEFRFSPPVLVRPPLVLDVVCCMAVDNGCRDHLLHMLQCVTYVVLNMLLRCACEHFDQELVKFHVDAAVVAKYARCQHTEHSVDCCCTSCVPRCQLEGIRIPLVQWCLDTPCVTSRCRRSAQRSFVLDYRCVGSSKMPLVCLRHGGQASDVIVAPMTGSRVSPLR